MLLNNLSVYQNILKRSKKELVQREDKRYEVERLYSTSPIIFDYSETYMPEGTYMIEDEGSQKTTGDNNDESETSDKKEELKSVISKDSQITFQRIPIKKVEEGDPVRVSALSKLVAQMQTQEEENGGDTDKDASGIPLTIYLPDCSSMTVHVVETSNFREVILQILKAHEKQGLQPPLEYRDPGMYELRIHEGDGEPDRDFPALGSEKLLSDFNLDEYCICAVEGRKRAATGNSAGPRGTAQTTTDTFSPPMPHVISGLSGIGGIRQSVSAGALSSGGLSGMGGGSSKNRDRDDTVDTFANRQGRARSSSKQSYDSFENSVSTVLVNFPDGTQVVVPFKEDTRLIHLLSKISKTKRLRLYTNEYVFAVSTADQKRLKLMSPNLDMQQPVGSLGATTLEIHNKVYQDVGKVERSLNSSKKRKSSKKSNKSNFTEAMANAYQEWNVVKKNKFGRKQERVFGVDGKKIYNSKRGQLRGGNQTGVQRAERNISTIVKLDILPADPKTFRITWMDDRDVYNIEYTCETTRECAEIVAKINYTREKYK